jgi:hypothetical protein
MSRNAGRITEALYLSGRAMTFRELRAAIWELWATRLSRRDVRLASYGNAHLRRAGSTLYLLDREAWADRFWRDLESAVPSN